MPPLFDVVAPGLLSTVQDHGRPDAANLGVPRSGACDPWSMEVANLLLGNDPGAACLEMTLLGPTLDVLAACTVALAGADLGARDLEEDRALVPGASYHLRPGTTLAFRGGPSGGGGPGGSGGPDGPGGPGGGPGARAYLAVPGGFDVPQVLGSASTCLAGAFGGLEGRALRAGDRLSSVGAGESVQAGARWAGPSPSLERTGPIRLLPGPHAPQMSPSISAGLVAQTWTVSTTGDRMGLRLEGPVLVADSAADGGIVSIPVTWGSIQLPSGGQPIVLLADHQTVGGYLVVAVVCSADLPRLGQLAPNDEVRFSWISLDEARDAYRAQRAALLAGAAALRREDPWERLVEAAEG